MKRLLIVFIITICLGGCIYFITTLFPKDDLESEFPNEEETEESYEFDISYGKKTTLEEIETEIVNNKEVIILIGTEKEDVTKKVSSILGTIENIESHNVYYLEKSEMTDEETYQNLLNNYPDLSNYINFTPVILVFRNNELIGGLPGEVEERNIKAFLEYAEVII